MKKLLFILLLFPFCITSAFAYEDIVLDTSTIHNENKIVINDVQKDNVIDSDDTLDTEDINAVPLSGRSEESPAFTTPKLFARAWDSFCKLDCDRTDVAQPLLSKYFTKEFKRGPFEKVRLWNAVQSEFDIQLPEVGHSVTKYNVRLINTIIDGTFRGGKEGFKIMFDPTKQDKCSFMQYFVQDVYVYTTRIPHHTIMLGNSRVGVGDEGRSSSFLLPFATRSQIARNLANVRKCGLRIKGDYKLVDYDFGGYSSDVFWREFFPGAEFDAWVNLKPLGMTDGRYGKLVVGGGISTGRNDVNYFVSGAYVGYSYKKFWAKFEYNNANGYNSTYGPSRKKAQGLCVTAAYKITPKLEILARYDWFDPDKNVSNNNSSEYTCGINYYLKGQALRLILNYVYCQKQNAVDSHRIVVGTQIIL